MYNDALKRMGMYRVLNQGVVQYNSVVFRVVAGVLGLLPLETVAIVSSIEKVLNALLEVPTGFLADKYGRVRSASWGLILIILGLVALYLAIIFKEYKTFSYTLIILDGIMIGIAVPLTSGSIDAFYQESLVKYAKDEDQSKNSFTVSARFGRWIPFFSIAFAFSVLYILNLFNMAHHGILIGIFFWIYVLIKINMDMKVLGDDSSSIERQASDFESLSSTLKKFFQVNELRKSLLMTCLFRVFSGMVLGFFIISIGREYQEKFPSDYLILMASFMLGCFGPGWLIVGTLLPKWIEGLSEKQYLVRLLVGSLLTNGLFLFLYKKMSFVSLTIFLFIYGAFFIVKVIGLQNLSKNILLSKVNKEDYAKYLSVISMFGLGTTGVYQIYISIFRQGAPSLNEIAYTSIGVLIGALLVVNLFNREVISD